MKKKSNWSTFLLVNVVAAMIISSLAFVTENYIPSTQIPLWFLGEPISGFALKIAILFLLGGIFLIVFVDTIARYIESLSGHIDIVTNQTDENYNTIRNDIHLALKDGVVDLANGSLVVFDADRARGKIYNVLHDTKTHDPDDYVRNVLFDTSSITCILETIHNNTHVPKVDGQYNLLFEIGLTVGKRFGSTLCTNLREERNQKFQASGNNLHAWLLAWSKYDSTAGWGRFYVDETKEEWDRHRSIVLKHSFLVDHNSERICDFMAGYLQGVIREFPYYILEPYGLDNNLIIEHPEDHVHCAHFSGDHERGCTYKVRAA